MLTSREQLLRKSEGIQTRVLQFENARVLGTLYANDLKLLKTIEESLAVKLTARDGSLRIEGEDAGLELARNLFDQLDRARRNGVAIRRHEVLYALRALNGPKEDALDELVAHRVVCSPRRPPIIPKTAGQSSYLKQIAASDMVFGVGPAGTGKTYLAMAMAIAALKRDEVTRIVLTRPAVEAGEALGFLPGDLKEKILPYLRPLYDALQDMLEGEEVQRLMERGVIEIAPLAYMRGRTLNHAFVILDEAQNTTTEQMFMFLTRLGADSKCVVTGDPTQIDLPAKKRSGLVEALQVLQGVEGIAFCQFSDRDVVRHPLVQSIVRAYRRYRGTGDSESNLV
jgi:phosphate starvation-inducible PhoH-like protein